MWFACTTTVLDQSAGMLGSDAISGKSFFDDERYQFRYPARIPPDPEFQARAVLQFAPS
jgi:hypothetical protein